jgi:hypothetical protein
MLRRFGLKPIYSIGFKWRDSKAVMPRPAKPFRPVRLWFAPPKFPCIFLLHLNIFYIAFFIASYFDALEAAWILAHRAYLFSPYKKLLISHTFLMLFLR